MNVGKVCQITAWGNIISRRVYQCETTDLRGLGGFMQSYSRAFTQASNYVETFFFTNIILC